jgi:heterotetrameric sarcosine oxidase gamma subunit
VRLTGPRAASVLAKVCAIDFTDRVMPDGSALGTSVARLATDIVRDDVAGSRSYLLHCERSSGQHLFDRLLDAGREFGIDVDGYANP